MKIAQIAVGSSYEDRSGKTVRTVFSRHGSDGIQMVEYTERPSGEEERPLYWRLRETHSLALAKFARWAARHAKSHAETNQRLSPVEIVAGVMIAGIRKRDSVGTTKELKELVYHGAATLVAQAKAQG